MARSLDLAVRAALPAKVPAQSEHVLASIGSAVLVTDLNHTSLMCNGAFGRLFHVNPWAVVAMEVRELREVVLPQFADPQSWLQNLDDVYADPASVQRDVLQLERHGCTLWRHTGPAYDVNGTIWGRIWNFFDYDHTPLKSSKLSVAQLEMNRENRVVLWMDCPLHLTQLEFTLLWKLCESNGQPVRRTELFRSAWGYDLECNSNSLDVYVARLRKKLAAVGAAPSIRNVRGFGYALDISS